MDLKLPQQWCSMETDKTPKKTTPIYVVPLSGNEAEDSLTQFGVDSDYIKHIYNLNYTLNVLQLKNVSMNQDCRWSTSQHGHTLEL